MKNIAYFLTSGLMVMALASCEKNLEVAGAAEGNSMLSIITRAAEGDAKVSYPVLIYAMNPDGQCVRRQQINSAADQLMMKLEPMTYQIYAVGGATDGDYTLPGQDGATATSEITLNAEVEHDDLMTANNSVTIAEDEDATLTLSMSRKVMEMESIVIQNVPTTISKVSITLTPIYSDLLLNGSYTSTTFTKTIDLTEAADGTTWELANPIYMLPSNGNATITVKFEKNNTVNSFSYTAPVALEANKHIRIQGQYNGSGQFNLVGTITGVQWDGTTTIEFTFNENGSTGSFDDSGNDNQNDDGIEEGAAPAATTIYKDCYVFSTTDDETGEYKIVKLLYNNEVDITGTGKTQEEVMTEINAALPTFSINGITGWKLPSAEEVDIFKSLIPSANSNFENIDGAKKISTSSEGYYYMDDVTLKTFYRNSTYTLLDQPFTSGQHLRPVKTLKFNKNAQ